ncbi:type VII secretion protein EccE [Streptomyces polyrhachis]|uniref:Type VII secretion protein EccE n=1 Tax=Streptomyces polyrhachis TaxID=1282885 RepID=A0ABW2GCJ6_9ACTN
MGTATTARGPTRGDEGGGPRGGPSAPVPLRTEPPALRLGPVRLGQLVLVELALAVFVGAVALDDAYLVPAGAVAVPLAVFALLRRHQRTVPDWWATGVAFRRRRAFVPPLPEPGADPALTPAAECVPGLRSYACLDRDRRTVGMLGDGTFLTALVRVEAGPGALRPFPMLSEQGMPHAKPSEQGIPHAGARALPLALLRGALDVDGIAVESVQVVQHVRPAPASHLPEQAVARRSYAALEESLSKAAGGASEGAAGGAHAPALRLTWVAVKFDPELCREAVQARGGGLAGAQKCLVRVADHVASRITGAGFRATVLDEDGVIAAVATSACANPLATARAEQPDAPLVKRTRENQRSWQCDDRWHTVFAVASWPAMGRGAAPLPRLVAALTSGPALATTFSLTVRRGPRRDSTRVHGHLRVTGRSESELNQALRSAEQLARAAKVSLVRLDREQLPGVVASLPLGGAL